MKLLKRITKGFLITLTILLISLYVFDYDYILKGVRVVYMTGHSTAFIDDHSYFDNRSIQKAKNVKTIPQHPQFNTVAPSERLDSIHNALGTTSFLILKNDSVWHEFYAPGYNQKSRTNSFSMAKSIITAMLGKAIMQKYIKSLNQPVGDFLPEFSEGIASQLTVGDLSSMASGLDWTEHYSSPFSITAKTYYDSNIREILLDLDVIKTPGTQFEYLSGNTQLLGMVIEKATGQSLSAYLSENFWEPLGMSQDGLWQLDSEASGMEKAYCCIASTARDFAKFGLLFQNGGRYDGQQILPEAFTKKAIQPRFEKSDMYGYGFWLSNHLNKNIFVMRGILGQYVISLPDEDITIVRLGHQRSTFKNGKSFTRDFYIYLEEALNMLHDAT
ncbi:serine hydrolase domain-containing protein [Aquimarina sp. W85]|uniref:serine hydrolase domain-containing protein n=1 Tax=Aquimarina rhodophyticola TaxID=3342246 RepID=UPI00367304C9